MQVTYRNRVVIWELNRPEQDNGLDITTIRSMELSLTDLERESEQQATCLLIVGHPEVFSTGLDSDLLETCFADAVIFREVVNRINSVLDKLEALPLVSIACVEGICKLGGLELALACDLIVVGENATMSDGHLAYDAMPGGGATRRLPARLGYSGALLFILGQETLSGTEAAKRRLVDEVVPTGQALIRGREMAVSLAAVHPSVVHAIKLCLRAASPRVMTRIETEEFQRTVINRLVTD